MIKEQVTLTLWKRWSQNPGVAEIPQVKLPPKLPLVETVPAKQSRSIKQLTLILRQNRPSNPGLMEDRTIPILMFILLVRRPELS